MSKETKIVSFIFLLFLTVGLIGLLSPLEASIKKLSFYNLFLTFGLVTLSFKNELKKFGISFIIVFSIGFIAELIGVHTGYVFGNYSYSNKLGISILEVPIIIGVNWAILSIGAWNLCKNITNYKSINILIACLLMVLFWSQQQFTLTFGNGTIKSSHFTIIFLGFSSVYPQFISLAKIKLSIAEYQN